MIADFLSNWLYLHFKPDRQFIDIKLKMKAIYLTKYGDANKAFEIREVPVPQIREDDVLIKVQYSGLNFADVIARRGLYPDAPKNPALLGYDVSGVIEAVGSNVIAFKPGQKVVAMTRFGGYAEYAVTHQSGVAIIPDSIDMANATVLATQACTAYYCAVDGITLHKGERVLVQAAAGGVGSILVQIAKHHGCYVFGTASGTKQEYLRELGVDHAIDYTKEDFFKVINDTEKPIDVVFDSLGGTAFRKGMKLLGPCGKMVCYGAAEQLDSIHNKFKLLSLAWGFSLFSPISLLMQSKAIITVNMLRVADFKPYVFHEILNHVITMTEKSIIKPTVSKIFKYNEIALAHDFLESRKSAGKVVIQWD